MTGTIEKLISDRRFGFIHSSGGEDVFFHASAMSQNDFPSLRVGQEVSFDVEHGDKGPKAVNVQVSRDKTLS